MAFNLGAVPVREAVRPAIAILLATALAVYLANRWLGDRKLASAIVSVSSILFFVHGPLITLVLGRIERAGVAAAVPQMSRYLLVLTDTFVFLAEIGSVIAVLKLLGRARQHLPVANQILLGIAVAALALPLIQIGAYTLRGLRVPPVQATALTQELSSVQPTDRAVLPDIYYIFLDGYGRADTLKDGYDIDISEFLEQLEGLGFEVAGRSRSNYSFTLLSMTSSLNMEYLDRLGVSTQPGTPIEEVTQTLLPRLRQSALRQVLEQQGYRTVAFDSGFAYTELWSADEYWRPSFQGISPFESLMIRTSLLGLVEDFASTLGAPYPYAGYQAHRQRILFAIDQVPAAAREPGPKFVFVHLLMPHPPFVFYRDGEPYPERHAYSIGDATQYTAGIDEYVRGYREAVLFLNRRLVPVLRSLIDDSRLPPVIVLQGDHGPGARLDWDQPTERAISERMGILNAYYFPDDLRGSVPDTITPVNSFRLVLGRIFDVEVEALPDRSYYSSPNDPFDIVPVPPENP
ncbi:MAG: sulfatase-like hydrolase/transferase [Anaerolineales bacterium]